MKLLTHTPLTQLLTREQDRNLNVRVLEMIAKSIHHNVESRKILDRVSEMEAMARHNYIWFNHPNRANWSRF